ncbi:21430_t:CDS:2 [Rhizophagus irregularis]|nr:21430_t:CDS:2 [Rhizophagus irregularis]
MRKKFLTLKTRTRRTWSRIEELEKGKVDTDVENVKRDAVNIELKAEIAKLRHDIDELKENHKFQTRCKGLSIDSTSWYKDVKKLEDIVNRDRQKRCICQDNEDNGISLLEVWYDEKPEIVIPKRIQKIKEFVCLASKRFDQ